MSQGGSVHAEIEAGGGSGGHRQQNGSTDVWTNEGTLVQERLTCSICHRAFRRPENLKRHAATHVKERRFHCSHPGCDKKFYRTDALQRHETVHQSLGKSKGVRSARACIGCAKARVKCTGETQCARCRNRSIECRYSERRSFHHQPDSRSCAASPILNQNDSCDPLSAPDGQSLRTNSVNVDVDTTNRGGPAVLQAPVLENRLSEAFASNALPGASSEPLTFSYQNQAGVLNLPTTSMTEGCASAFEVFDTDRGRSQQILDSSDAPVNFAGGLQRMPNGHSYEPEYFGPNMLSSLNWLPSEFSFADAELYGMQLSPQLIPGLPIETQTLFYPFQNVASATELSTISPQNDGSLSSHRSPSQSTQCAQTNPSAATPKVSGSNSQQGYYYVDGDGARLPRNGRRRKAKIPLTENSPFARSLQAERRSVSNFSFPDIVYFESEAPNDMNANGRDLNETSYQAILDCFNQTCVMPSIFPPFTSSQFPNLDTINRLIRMYLQYFQPLIPLLHLPTLAISTSHWVLPLALAAIGSHYVEVEGSEFTTIAMHEFLRRAIIMTEERRKGISIEDVTLIQAKFLNCIGLFYTGFDGFELAAQACYSNLINYCDPKASKPPTASGDLELDWFHWIGHEIRVRIRSCIWLLDTMLAYHFQIHPRIPWDVDVSLPCEEDTWEAPNAASWHDVLKPSSPQHSQSLHSVLRDLYMEKRIPSQTGEFAKIHLVHGLYRQLLWDVGQSLERPLSRWTPVAERIDSSTMTPDVWLPRIPKYEKWRNASCDVIDVLHWRANSIIATSGTENSTVHHLHLARIVLLTPYQHILNLVLFMAGESPSRSEEDVRFDRQRVRQWATEDQHKARLAMIHAGVGFWHIRRYSAGGFYEPSNIFLSTIAIWAYGSFSQLLASNQQNQRESSPSSSDSSAPMWIRLDRPTDDELVQLYVKHGTRMKATITGVGNISGAKGPQRALKEGRKILRELTNWGIGAKYIRILTRLADKYEASP